MSEADFAMVYGFGRGEGLRRGWREGFRHAIRLLAQCKRFGPPEPQFLRVLESIEDADHLEQIFLRIWELPTWAKILEPPPPVIDDPPPDPEPAPTPEPPRRRKPRRKK